MNMRAKSEMDHPILCHCPRRETGAPGSHSSRLSLSAISSYQMRGAAQTVILAEPGVVQVHLKGRYSCVDMSVRLLKALAPCHTIMRNAAVRPQHDHALRLNAIQQHESTMNMTHQLSVVIVYPIFVILFVQLFMCCGRHMQA